MAPHMLTLPFEVQSASAALRDLAEKSTADGARAFEAMTRLKMKAIKEQVVPFVWCSFIGVPFILR